MNPLCFFVLPANREKLILGIIAGAQFSQRVAWVHRGYAGFLARQLT